MSRAILYLGVVMAEEIYKKLKSLFNKQQCWMIKQLADQLEFSIPSIRRFLAAMGYYSSFTHNGRWYTLDSKPQFNRDGLWFHSDIGFSRAGSLTNTLVVMVTKSFAGLTAEQLGEKLHCRCHSVLVNLCRQKKLQRRKIGRSFIYMAIDSGIAAKQQKAILLQSPQTQQLPAEIALQVLVEFIRNPNADFVQLSKTIKRKLTVTIQPHQIERLFQQYNLKKTIVTVAQSPGEH